MNHCLDNRMKNNMKIPYSIPLINEDVVNEVNDALKETGWITSGPKVLQFEKEIKNFTQSDSVICVNSWTSGAMLAMRWFGLEPGDEVIIPSYTYAATALSILNIGAKPIMVDVKDDFTIDPKKIIDKISKNTKVIMPVDIGGWPSDYKSIYEIINLNKIKNLFIPKNHIQEKLNRILIISDSAHSFGAKYMNKQIGSISDITVFSFHSVKNITTGEGGAVCLKLPNNFDIVEEERCFKNLSLNGQNKSSFEKNQIGGWRYDIIDKGLKVNMPDICAAIGIAQIRIYKETLLPERKKIFEQYDKFFKNKKWAKIPLSKNNKFESSYHLYMLRINSIDEKLRDKMISYISSKGVGVNVHYIPMPQLTLFKNLNYKISDYPITYNLYCNEITLPVYNNLTSKEIDYVCHVVEDAYLKTCN